MSIVKSKQTHDYAWGQEYEEKKTNVSAAIMLQRVKTEIEVHLLPLLQIIDGFEVAYVMGMRRNALGLYISGTSSHPYIALSWNAIKRSCDENGVHYQTGIETTIVHELGHPLEEAMGLKADEERAEGLACHWHEKRCVSPAFEELLKVGT